MGDCLAQDRPPRVGRLTLASSEAGVLVAKPVQLGVAGAIVTYLTAFKHKDLIRELGHQREIVADKDHYQYELSLQPRQKPQHLPHKNVLN